MGLNGLADNGHLPVVQYLCEQGADKKAYRWLDKLCSIVMATSMW